MHLSLRSQNCPPSALQRLLGRYHLVPDWSATILRGGDHLFFQAEDYSAYELFPQTPTTFFIRAMDIVTTFQTGPDGQTTGLVFHQAGQDRPATR